MKRGEEGEKGNRRIRVRKKGTHLILTHSFPFKVTFKGFKGHSLPFLARQSRPHSKAPKDDSPESLGFFLLIELKVRRGMLAKRGTDPRRKGGNGDGDRGNRDDEQLLVVAQVSDRGEEEASHPLL